MWDDPGNIEEIGAPWNFDESKLISLYLHKAGIVIVAPVAKIREHQASWSEQRPQIIDFVNKTTYFYP